MLDILKFELKYRITRPATWAYFGLLAFGGFLIAANNGLVSSEKAFANSAYSIVLLMMVFSIFGTLIASAVMGVPVYRDIEHGVKNYYFTYPVKEKSYLLGRYLGSFLTLMLISLGLVVGLVIGYSLGPVLGWEEAERFGPHRWGAYLNGLVFFLWPNLLFVGTIFFCLVALTRKIFVSYVGSILFFIGYLVAQTLSQDLDNTSVAAMLDPFGTAAWTEATKYWTPNEQNELIAPITGDLLLNRLVYLGLTVVILVITLFRFDFQRFLGGTKARKIVAVGAAAGAGAGMKKQGLVNPAPAVVGQTFDNGVYLRQMISQAWIEFKSVLRDPYFLAIMIGAVLFLFLDAHFGNTTYGTPSLPVTYYMVEAKNGTYILFVMIVLVFYTGEVVHRDRTVKFNQIADALPIPNWTLFGGKLLTMTGVAFLLATMVWVVGIFQQTVKGYFEYDFGQYFTDLYLLTFPQYLVLMTLAFAVHVLVNKKFVGHVVAIGLYAAILFIPGMMDVDYNMFLFGSRPGYTISDMNGFGHFLAGVTSFNIYWLAFGTMLLVGSLLMWARGTDDAWKSRFKLAAQRANWRPLVILGGAFAVFALMGFSIYNNVSVKNSYVGTDATQDMRERYERTYRRYRGMNQPKITAVDYAIDLFPKERAADGLGTFAIRNVGDAPIDTILLETSYGEKVFNIETFTIGGQALELVKADNDANLSIYTLSPALQPGDSSVMVMEVRLDYQGYPNEGSQSAVVENGTFLNSGLFPSFGYSGGGEIGSNQERKKRGLEIRDYGLPEPTDQQGRNTLLFDANAYLVDFSATISTEADQIAIAPGKLVNEYEQDGRKFYEYKNEGKIQNFFNISSARYEVREEMYRTPTGQEIKLQIFHHPEHDKNLDRYLKSMKASLDYYTSNFSPYQFDQLRLLEFPRYSTFAQSFPNTVPYAESFGWVGDFGDPNDTDYAFTVTAHEVAHQWWGHQITPSATRGANQLSETMAEYGSLMVMKEVYGEEAMPKFLKYELDRYLGSRAGESKFEKTLLDNDDQSYVWYRKGAMIMYALADYVGEESLNQAFSEFIGEFGLRAEPPFPTSLDWYAAIKAATPDSLQYYLKESFEEITLYENRALTATYNTKPNAAGKYTVTLKVDTRKITYNGEANEIARPDGESLIDIGVFAADGTTDSGLVKKTPLYLQKKWLTPGEHTFTIEVDAEPAKAGIDPYNKLIDRVSDDNLINVDAE